MRLRRFSKEQIQEIRDLKADNPSWSSYHICRFLGWDESYSSSVQRVLKGKSYQTTERAGKVLNETMVRYIKRAKIDYPDVTPEELSVAMKEKFDVYIRAYAIESVLNGRTWKDINPLPVKKDLRSLHPPVNV